MDGSRVRPYADVRRGAGAGTPSSSAVRAWAWRFCPPGATVPVCVTVKPWSPTDCNRLHVFLLADAIHPPPSTHTCSLLATRIISLWPRRCAPALRGAACASTVVETHAPLPVRTASPSIRERRPTTAGPLLASPPALPRTLAALRRRTNRRGGQVLRWASCSRSGTRGSGRGRAACAAVPSTRQAASRCGSSPPTPGSGNAAKTSPPPPPPHALKPRQVHKC